MKAFLNTPPVRLRLTGPSQAGTTAGVMYPIFDAHGNMTGTICRSGTNSFSLANQRSYDAWGLVRSGSGSGDPAGRCCANLGHKQDDESGLIYMCARYYEPGSGRFISQDPGENGHNWFAYASGRPTTTVDCTGRNGQELTDLFGGVDFLNLLFGGDVLRHVYHIGVYGTTHPGEYSVSQGTAAMIGIALLTAAVAIITTVCFLAAVAATSILAGIILVAFAAMLIIIAEISCDALEDQACNYSRKEERGGW